MDACMGGWVGGWMGVDGWMDGWVGGWREKKEALCNKDSFGR